MTSEHQFSCAYYGKVPTHGDYVSARMSHGIKGSLHDWLRECITDAQEYLGKEAWLTYFLKAPVWRFCIGSGVLSSSHGMVGIMIPSIDRVGRYFSFMTLLPFDPRWLSKISQPKLDGFLNRLELLTLTTLDDDFNLGFFDHALLQLKFNEATDYHHRNSFQPMAQPLNPNHFAGRSVWWTQGGQYCRPGRLEFQGLPIEKGYRDLVCSTV